MTAAFSTALLSYSDPHGIARTLQGAFLKVSENSSSLQNLYGVEGLYSHEYSIGIFGFLVLSLLVFIGIMYIFWTKSNTRVKKGEMVMFGAILMGVLFAFVFGYIQMVQGYLF